MYQYRKVDSTQDCGILMRSESKVENLEIIASKSPGRMLGNLVSGHLLPEPVSTFSGIAAILIFLAFINGSNGREGVNNTLKCYQCHIQGSNETVCDNDLFTCPNNQAYDRCMINTKRNATTGEVTISKGCALAPCEFEKEVESIIFSGKCDLDRPGADCVKCCMGDGCNKRSLATSVLFLRRSSDICFCIVLAFIPILILAFTNLL